MPGTRYTVPHKKVFPECHHLAKKKTKKHSAECHETKHSAQSNISRVPTLGKKNSAECHPAGTRHIVHPPPEETCDADTEEEQLKSAIPTLERANQRIADLHIEREQLEWKVYKLERQLGSRGASDFGTNIKGQARVLVPRRRQSFKKIFFVDAPRIKFQGLVRFNEYFRCPVSITADPSVYILYRVRSFLFLCQ